jgi:hypothetical protein
MKILLRIEAVFVVVAILFSSHVVSCQGHAQQHDWVNDDSDVIEDNAIMKMSSEEDNQRVKVMMQPMSSSNTVSTRHLRSSPSRRRVDEDDYDVTGGYATLHYGYGNQRDLFCKNIGKAWFPLPSSGNALIPLPSSGNAVLRRSGTIKSLASDEFPSLPTPVANVSGKQKDYNYGVSTHLYAFRSANNSAMFEDAAACYNVTLSSSTAASSNRTYDDGVSFLEVYQGSSRIASCEPSLLFLDKDRSSTCSLLLLINLTSSFTPENLDDVFIAVSTIGNAQQSLPYELYITVRCFVVNKITSFASFRFALRPSLTHMRMP